MGQPRAVKVLEVCQVAPPQGTTTSTSSTPISLPLTYFDLVFLRFPPSECLLFYAFPNPNTSFFDSIIPNLKHSLALTLQHFIPLAGNITWPIDSPFPIINYVPGDAVSFTIAESNANFNNLCSNICEAMERYPLIPHLTTSHEKASLLALQVTLFPNSGFCIGITTHHAAMDGNSSTMFKKAWAYTCCYLNEPSSYISSLLSLPKNLAPFFDKSVIIDRTKGHADLIVNQLLNQDGPNNRSLKVLESIRALQSEPITASFELDPSHIQKLKQYAQSELKMKDPLSTFSVTYAYAIACLVKVEQPKVNRVAIVFAVDCRSRMEPPLVPTYFGNCVVGKVVVADTDKLLGNDAFINALEGICDGLNKLKNKGQSVETLISERRASKEKKVFTVAGSPRLELYSVDFGWGRPKKVEITSIDKTGSISLFESRNNSGGIEIGLTLDKREMEAFADHFIQGLDFFTSFETSHP